MMTPAEIITATLTKRKVYTICDNEIVPTLIIACHASMTPKLTITLYDGTMTNLLETEFYASRRDAARVLLKIVKKVEKRLAANYLN